MNSPDRPRQRTTAGSSSRVTGRLGPVFFGFAGASPAAAWPSPSATAVPPLRLVPIITAPSRYAAGARRWGSRLDVGQVPPLDAGVEHRHGDDRDGAEVLEPGAEVDDAAAEDALGEADQDAAHEGDAE